MTAVNYNDGSWYGWNGGECPVHPETVVECRLQDAAEYYSGRETKANDWDWSVSGVEAIIAFRVIKEHKEPREFYAREMVTLSIPGGKSDTYWQECSPTATGATLFREVIQ